MAIKLEIQPVVTISSGGTSKPLSTTSIPVTSVIIQAEYTNVGRISIGDAAVTSNTGMEIGPGDTFTISMESIYKTGEFDLADIYVVSSTSGDSVRVMTFRRK